MNKNKWFLEMVQDFDGKYYANMFIGGSLVEGLPKNVSYDELRDAIRSQTGIEILKKKDMRFESYKGKKFAYLDCTQEREDCRVSLRELEEHWYPKFEAPVVGDKIYIYPHVAHTLNLDDACILEGTVVDRTPALPIEGVPWAATVSVHIENRLYRDGSVTPENLTRTYYDSDSLYEHSLKRAQEKAAEVYALIDAIKALPLESKPARSLAMDYFEALDLKALSDAQLLEAIDLAKKFECPYYEMESETIYRFEKYTKKTLDEQIRSALTRTSAAPSTDKSPEKESTHER